MIVMVSSSSLWLSLLDLKVLLTLWLSANPFRVNWVTSSSKVEGSEINRNAPWILPCGIK